MCYDWSHGTYTRPVRTHRTSIASTAGQCKLPNLQVLNAILYVAEQGCKWRGLPPRFGRWHTIYTRMNRWAKNGVLDRIFEHLQREQIVRVKLEVVSMDGTIVKVHPDGTGALKKRAAVHRQVQGWMDHQDSYGCRGCSNSHDLLALPWTSSRRTGRAQVARTPWAPAREPGCGDGPCIRGQRDTPACLGVGIRACRSASFDTDQPVGVRQGAVQETQRGRAPVPAVEGLSSYLLSI